MRTVTVLGSTGSIGTQTLDIVRRQKDYRIVGLVCGSNLDVFVSQVQEFRPQFAAIMCEELLPTLKERLKQCPETTLLAGAEGINTIASQPVDWCMAAISGTQGMLPTLTAAQFSKTIALANKEALVIAGEHLKRVAMLSGCRIIPVDSEHSAIFQIFDKQRENRIKRVILTASGGPFLNTPLSEFSSITPESAVSHPNWSMGPKVSVDSACLINKILELIEAHYLFGLTPRQYDVWIHPQSIVHSFVEYVDGVLLAQMGIPSMLPPIAYAYTWPDRMSLPEVACDLPQWPNLSFMIPDETRFPIFSLRHAILEGGASSKIAFTVSAETAVLAFLSKRLSFNDIVRVIEETLAQIDNLLEGVDLSQNMGNIIDYLGRTQVLSQKIVQKISS